MKIRIRIMVKGLLFLALAYMTWEYDYLWARVLICLFTALIGILLLSEAIFYNEDRHELDMLLSKIKKDLVHKASISTEDIRKLESFQTTFGLRLRESLFSIFKKH